MPEKRGGKVEEGIIRIYQHGEISGGRRLLTERSVLELRIIRYFSMSSRKHRFAINL